MRKNCVAVLCAVKRFKIITKANYDSLQEIKKYACEPKLSDSDEIPSSNFTQPISHKTAQVVHDMKLDQERLQGRVEEAAQILSQEVSEFKKQVASQFN